MVAPLVPSRVVGTQRRLALTVCVPARMAQAKPGSHGAAAPVNRTATGLAIRIGDAGAQDVTIFRGNLAGGFASPVSLVVGMPVAPDMAAGDINGDGRADLACSCNGADQVRVLLSN